MIDLLINIDKCFSNSSLDNLRVFLNKNPKSEWYFISDYCFDPFKQSDVLTFTLINKSLNLTSLIDYIKEIAPKDIKNTRLISGEFLNFINSEDSFHISIILNKEDDFLKSIIREEVMLSYLRFLENELPNIDYPETEIENVEKFIKRIKSFLTEFSKKSFNLRLARKILFTSSILGLLTHYLFLYNRPLGWTWISDRDSIISKYDGFAFDNSFHSFFFSTMVLAKLKNLDLYSTDFIEHNRLKIPLIFHIDTGIESLDELIRIPDYLSGTLADYDFNKNKFTKPKFSDVFSNTITNSKNHIILQITVDEERTGYYTKRIKFQ